MTREEIRGEKSLIREESDRRCMSQMRCHGEVVTVEMMLSNATVEKTQDENVFV